MAEAQGTTASATQDKKGGAPVQDDSGESWLSKPENLGNSAGDRIQETLKPIGDTVGSGLASVVKPVGGVVDSVVGGVMRGGGAFGETVGVGSGNKDGGPGKIKETKEAEAREELKKGLGGNEQGSGNPLGL